MDAARVHEVAQGLAALGVEPGDGVMLVVEGDVRQEAAVALAELGARVVPLSPDLVELVARGEVQHVIARAEDTWELDGVAGNCTRIAVGPKVVGWARYPA